MKVFIFLLGLLAAIPAHAATCCGGSFAAPSLITSDDNAQATVSFSQARVIDDVYENGKWSARSNPEYAQSLKVEAAHLLSDRWQAGGSLPVIRRQRDAQESTDESWGLGDASADVAYEYLPEWSYSVWKPKGVGFLQLTAPTGKSANESTQTTALDVRGRGFWSVGLGSVLTKLVYPFDLQMTWEVHRSFPRDVSSTAGVDRTLIPGWGGSFYLGAGWSRGDIRIGGGLSWNYEDAIRTSDSSTNPSDPDGSLQRFATGVVQVAYLFNENWAVNGSYSDQTLFGSPNNTTLSRTVLVGLQRRWPR